MYECIQCGAYFATSSAYTGNTPKCRGCRSAGGNKRKDRKKQADDEERRRRAAEADEERRRWAAAAEAEEERRRVAAEARRARVAAIDKHQRDAHNNSMRCTTRPTVLLPTLIARNMCTLYRTDCAHRM